MYFLYDIIRNKTYFSPMFLLEEVVGAVGPFVLPQEYLMGLFGQTQYEDETSIRQVKEGQIFQSLMKASTS